MLRLFKSNLLKSLNKSIEQTIKSNSIINSICFSSKIKSYSTFNVQTPKIAIIGSGPAALYTAQYVLKNINKENPPIVDIYEKLPVPFGLVRYGVAPDHQDVKNVINSFTETLKKPNVNFIGNVNIGVELKINELIEAYNCVVLAYGSHGENYLNIPGEKGFKNMISAKDFVSWYNGLPQSENIEIDLNTKNAVIIGAGNVAIDIARLLLTPIKKLEQTDISAKALEVFKTTNKVEHVSIIARRGILNAAFTLKELRELSKIESVECQINHEQFNDIEIEHNLNKLARPRKRITEYMLNLSKSKTKAVPNEKKKVINFVFLRTPVEILGDNGHVKGLKLRENRYVNNFLEKDLKLDSEEALNQLKIEENPGKPIEIIDAGLVIRSIGYKNVNIDTDDIPFDKKSGTILNNEGKVINKEGLYCTGWIKRGPRGVIVDTTSDAYETAQKLCNDLKNNAINKQGFEKIVNIFKERGIKFVDKEGWSRIDQEEIRRGKLVGKPREKFQSIDEMLKIAFEV